LQVRRVVSASNPSPLIDRFGGLADGYDAVLSDVWGVIHNGVAATPEACDALMRFRAKGGSVALITNAPRPGAVVTKFLDKLGVPREAYDTIVSSGDVTRAVITARPGKNVLHIGPERDVSIFDGLGLNFVALEQADYAVCTGLHDDETETAESYRAVLTKMRARSLFMVCGNPDLVVERGDKLVYCAGALADLYAELGGDVLYAGKPHAPIYDECLARIARLRGGAVPRSRVLAIGDSVRTDLTGAEAMGIHALFVIAGIHAEEVGRDAPDTAALQEMFTAAGVAPRAVTRKLAW
jgi:HAD superfamily hydrolase (TIGR01459 family)